MGGKFIADINHDHKGIVSYPRPISAITCQLHCALLIRIVQGTASLSNIICSHNLFTKSFVLKFGFRTNSTLKANS